MTEDSSSRKRTDRPGPEPERLKIEGPWEEAIKKALRKKKPPEGSPKEEKQGKE